MKIMILRFLLLFLIHNCVKSQDTSDCDITSGCYRQPIGCTTQSCKYLVKWQADSNNVYFQLYGNILSSSSTRYLAIGFSNDRSMGSDDVSLCESQTNSVAHYFNSGSSTSLQNNNPYQNIKVSKNGNWLICSFTRSINDFTINNFFNLANSYYLLLASGSYLSSPNYHDERFPSSLQYNFTAFQKSNVTQATSQISTTLSIATTQSYIPQNSSESLEEIKTTDCGTTLECFRIPENCDSIDCKFIIKWKPYENKIDFTLIGNLGDPTNKYLAIGFSYDDEMEDDDVAACQTSTGTVDHYFNVEDGSNYVDSNSYSNILVNQNGAWLSCSFTRLKMDNSKDKFYDLTNNSFYLLVATGPSSASGSIATLMYHGSNGRFHSDSKINFSWSATQIVTTSSTPLLSTLSTPKSELTDKTSECGVSYGCFRLPEGCVSNNCQFIIKWKPGNNSIDFILNGNLGDLSNKYLAIGFSTDSKMGDDDVAVCQTSTGTVDHYFNVVGYSNYLDSNSYTNIQVIQNGTWLSCSFTRRMQDSSNGKSSIGRSITSLSNHGSNGRFVSSSAVNFTDVGLISAKSPNSNKIKAHGCLMIIAWMIFASIGILFARYYKDSFPDWKLCSLDFWFVVHRPVMILVAVISVISFILILAQLDWKWLSLENGSISFSHSIFGIVAISFSVIQVVLGALRPDKNAKNRYLFNHGHRTLGILSMLFAMVALFLGVNIENMNLDQNSWILLVAWAGWVFLVPIVFLEPIKLRSNRQDSYMFNKNGSKAKYVSSFKSILMLIHVLVVVGLSIALIVLIGIADVK